LSKIAFYLCKPHSKNIKDQDTIVYQQFKAQESTLEFDTLEKSFAAQIQDIETLRKQFGQQKLSLENQMSDI
jgi:hypothetical protein